MTAEQTFLSLSVSYLCGVAWRGQACLLSLLSLCLEQALFVWCVGILSVLTV